MEIFCFTEFVLRRELATMKNFQKGFKDRQIEILRGKMSFGTYAVRGGKLKFFEDRHGGRRTRRHAPS